MKAPPLQIQYPADCSVMPVRRFVWRPAPAPLPIRMGEGKVAGKRLIVLGGSAPVSREVIDTLTRLGATVSHFRVGDSLPAVPGPVDGIIDLNLGDDFDPADRTGWKNALRQTVTVLEAVYSDWLSVTDCSRIFYMPVTSMDGKMGYGGGALTQPLGGIWAGLAKTLPREIPNCNVKILDVCLQDRSQTGEIIAREVYDWGLFEIGYCEGVRYCLMPEQERVQPQEISLSPDDAVLISGGGRGIGLALARELAECYGCRVVVTGRSAAPSGSEDWLGMSEADLKAHRNDLLRNANANVAAVRRNVEQMSRQIDLYRHLKRIEQEGLPIEYRVCDFNNASQVRALLDSIGPRLSGIVHNAGVDTPKRLSAKSAESFIETISIKVDGFLSILDAAGERPLKFFCSVGSLTGRMGGMVGQLDYAAGNDGLARLGLWANFKMPYPVKTLCWPTWEKLGMIANYDATLKYMSALNVEEGLDHWRKELVSGGASEVAYIGNFGKALSPVQMNGFPMILDLPQSSQLFSHCFYLGKALSSRPFAHMRSANQIDPRTASWIGEFFWQGLPAMPVSVLLEFALSVGDWVTPEGYPGQELTEIREVRIYLPGLTKIAAGCVFEKHSTGRWESGKWTLDVRVSIGGRSKPEPVAELKLVYGERSAGAMAEPAAAAVRNECKVQALRWAGHLFRLAPWGKVSDCSPSDLWSMPFCPRQSLPSSHLENLLRNALLEQEVPECPDELWIENITFHSGVANCSSIQKGEGDAYLVLDDAGVPTLSVRGIQIKAGAAVHSEVLAVTI